MCAEELMGEVAECKCGQLVLIAEDIIRNEDGQIVCPECEEKCL